MVRPDDETRGALSPAGASGVRSQMAELASSARSAQRDARRAPIQLLANIEFPHEVAACQRRNADGIGLYRTEFLYLGADTEPTEEDHFRAYREVVQAMGDRPVVIRTLDLGADKMGHLPRTEDEHNPFLGLRSIRLSLRNVDLFRIQLRAILRASVLGQRQDPVPVDHHAAANCGKPSCSCARPWRTWKRRESRSIATFRSA